MSAPIRVLFWHSSYPPVFSGHAVQMDRLRSRLLAAGIACEVWTVLQPDSPAREWRDGVLVRRFGPVGSSRLQCYERQLQVMRALVAERSQYDIYQLCGLNNVTQLGAAAALLAGRRVIAQMSLIDSDDPLTLRRGAHPWLKTGLHRRIHRWVSLGGALTGAYLEAGLPPEKLEVIPVAVDLERFKPTVDPRAVRQALELPLDSPLVLMVGHLIRRKGYDVMVEAIPAILARVPQARFLFAGPLEPVVDHPPLGDWIEQRARALGVRDRIHLLGRTDRVPELLQAADVFAFPSRQEGLPNAVLEAAACACPIVMSDLPGVAKELVRPGENGFVVPRDDPQALARTVSDLLLDPALRVRVGEQARRQILERYDLAVITGRWQALYQQVMTEPVWSRR